MSLALSYSIFYYIFNFKLYYTNNTTLYWTVLGKLWSPPSAFSHPPTLINSFTATRPFYSSSTPAVSASDPDLPPYINTSTPRRSPCPPLQPAPHGPLALPTSSATQVSSFAATKIGTEQRSGEPEEYNS
jgi:hypothetical protein